MSHSRSNLLFSLLLVCASAHAQYTSKILNPPGSSVSHAYGAYNGRQVGSGGGAGIQTAALWSGTSASAVVLGPSSGGWQTWAWGIGGNQQMGMGSGSGTGFAFHALMWTGTQASMVDMHPAGYDVSAGYATDGTMQAGQAAVGGVIHAMAWSGTAASAVDLMPAGATESHAYGASAGRQSGVATFGGIEHGMLWSGSAASAVDLNGTLVSSLVNGMDATHQVGAGELPGGVVHAMMWSGTAESVVDLNSAGYDQTGAEGVGAGVVAGFGIGTATGQKQHALAWVGGKTIDLHSFLPAGYSSSIAMGVDPITGQIVGEATNSLNRSIAFMWTPLPTPEPSTWLGLALGGVALFRKRRSVR